MTTPYIDPNLIFAENAPVQDKPAAFANYDKGWDESRNNDGRPLIPQMNYLSQQADLKNLYIHENGAALPYKDGISYEENAVVVKDGVLQQWSGGEWVQLNTASNILDTSGVSQQVINNAVENNLRVLVDPLTKEGVLGDGQYRNITDLWTVGTDSYKFVSRAAAESYLGFNITNELIDVGLNSSVDTAYLQKYIIAASTRFISTGVPTTIKLKSSATYIITGLQLYPGVNLISEGQTEFKKRPALDVTSEAILKWWRIATCKASAFATEAATKHRNIIDGIKFNGNMLAMNWTYGTYNQEQGSSLILQCGNGVTKDIRAKFDLRNLIFVDSVGDGLHIVQNTDVIYSNLQAQNCFRGGIVITGGNSIIYGDGSVVNNARTDIEIDSAGFGGSKYLYANIKNHFQDIGGKNGDFVGGCDLGGVGGSEFYFENFNVHSAPTNILTGDGVQKAKSFVFKNGTLTLGAGSSAANRIINPIGMLFENTIFRLLDNGFLSILTFFNNYSAMQDYKFKDCKTEFLGTTLAAQVFKIESQPVASTGNMIIEGGDYSATPTQNLVSHTLGGKTKLDNVKHAVSSAIVYRRITTGYPSIVEFNKFNQQSTAVDLYAIESSIAATENQTIFNADSVVLSSLNLNTTNSVGLLKNKRTVFSDTAPTATTRSFIGDRFVLNVPEVGKPYEWIATTTSNTASVYRASRWLVGSYTTANLPVLTPFDVGSQNFDTTLNKLVTWNGTAWV